jgi:hypothetical protein
MAPGSKGYVQRLWRRRCCIRWEWRIRGVGEEGRQTGRPTTMDQRSTQSMPVRAALRPSPSDKGPSSSFCLRDRLLRLCTHLLCAFIRFKGACSSTHFTPTDAGSEKEAESNSIVGICRIYSVGKSVVSGRLALPLRVRLQECVASLRFVLLRDLLGKVVSWQYAMSISFD